MKKKLGRKNAKSKTRIAAKRSVVVRLKKRPVKRTNNVTFKRSKDSTRFVKQRNLKIIPKTSAPADHTISEIYKSQYNRPGKGVQAIKSKPSHQTVSVQCDRKPMRDAGVQCSIGTFLSLSATRAKTVDHHQPCCSFTPKHTKNYFSSERKSRLLGKKVCLGDIYEDKISTVLINED